jgi:hypothetical protein
MVCNPIYATAVGLLLFGNENRPGRAQFGGIAQWAQGLVGGSRAGFRGIFNGLQAKML